MYKKKRYETTLQTFWQFCSDEAPLDMGLLDYSLKSYGRIYHKTWAEERKTAQERHHNGKHTTDNSDCQPQEIKHRIEVEAKKKSKQPENQNQSTSLWTTQ